MKIESGFGLAMAGQPFCVQSTVWRQILIANSDSLKLSLFLVNDLAFSQARSKMEELTKKEVVSFAFILTDDGPELIGEEDLVTELMGVFEEKDIIQHAQLIKLRGQALNHRSTRTIKLQQMQEAFDTQLPPSPLPLGEMVDYDLLRSLFSDVMKFEGLGRLWQAGQDPPQSVQDWWGEDDWDVFRLYKNQNLTREMMDIVRGRHKQYSKHSIFYFKEKIINCYRLRLGVEHFGNYHMRLSKEEIEERKQARLRDEHQEQEARIRAAAEEEEQQRAAEIEAAVQARVQQELDARVERALQVILFSETFRQFI